MSPFDLKSDQTIITFFAPSPASVQPQQSFDYFRSIGDPAFRVPRVAALLVPRGPRRRGLAAPPRRPGRGRCGGGPSGSSKSTGTPAWTCSRHGGRRRRPRRPAPACAGGRRRCRRRRPLQRPGPPSRRPRRRHRRHGRRPHRSCGGMPSASGACPTTARTSATTARGRGDHTIPRHRADDPRSPRHRAAGTAQPGGEADR